MITSGRKSAQGGQNQPLYRFQISRVPGAGGQGDVHVGAKPGTGAAASASPVSEG